MAAGAARGADIAIGALAALIYLGEYLGQGAIANKALNAGAVTALATVVFGTLLTLAFSARRNPLSGPRFLSVVCYAGILECAAALPALRGGGLMLAVAVTSLSLSLSGLWLLLLCRFGWEGRLRALLSLPALCALAFVVATTTIAGQVSGLNRCGPPLAAPALAVAALVVVVAFLLKFTARPGSLLHRARLCVALAAGAGLYFAWRAAAPTPALCAAVGQIADGAMLDALLGAWRWPWAAWPVLLRPEVATLVLGGSALLALLCLVDTISAASCLASDEGRPDADTAPELRAVALANLCGGLLGLLPVSLSLSRSRTVAELKPASSRLPALAHAVVLLAVLACLVPLQLPLLDYLPKAVIAGALVVVSIEMVDEKSALLWRAGLGAPAARTTVAGALWVFLLAVCAAVLCGLSGASKFAVMVGLGGGVASALALWAASPRAPVAEGGLPLAGRLDFLNIAARLQRWKAAEPGAEEIDLRQTQQLDFSAACALADLVRGGHRLNGCNEASPQVREMVAICCPPAVRP